MKIEKTFGAIDGELTVGFGSRSAHCGSYSRASSSAHTALEAGELRLLVGRRERVSRLAPVRVHARLQAVGRRKADRPKDE